MATDYKSKGNIQNVSGQSSAASVIDIGDAGTAPEFFLPKQLVQINLSATAGGGHAVSDYCLMRISAVGAEVTKNSMQVKLVTGEVVRAASGEFTSYDGSGAGAPLSSVYADAISSKLEAMRCYVVGSSYEEGSDLLGKTWKDSPYSTGYGQTQIWRTEFGMTNTARATALKYEPNEFARVWRDKLIEHKWEIEQSGLFSSQAPVHERSAPSAFCGKIRMRRRTTSWRWSSVPPSANTTSNDGDPKSSMKALNRRW